MDSGVVRRTSDRALKMLDLGFGGSASPSPVKASVEQVQSPQRRPSDKKWSPPSYVPSLIYRRPKRNDNELDMKRNSLQLLSPNTITRRAKLGGQAFQSQKQSRNGIMPGYGDD